MEDALRKLGFLQQYDYWIDDVIDQKKKIADSKVDKIALLKEKRLFILYYDILQRSLRRDYGTIINNFELAQTIVNDSTYFGTYVYNNELNRYRIAINGHEFDLQHDNTYKIPYNEYVRFELTRFRSRYTEIDSVITHY